MTSGTSNTIYNLRFGELSNNAAVVFRGTEQECRAHMTEDLQKRGKKSYYTRQWTTKDNWIVIDYGSHNTFYYLEPIDETFTTEIACEMEVTNFENFAELMDNFLIPNKVVCRFYYEADEAGDEYAFYKVIIGYTKMYHDYLLHLVSAEGCETADDLDFNRIEFHLLSDLLKNGSFDVIPDDQF